MSLDASIPSLGRGSLTPKQLAERWQISERALRRWNKQRVLPFFKLGRKEVRYAVDDVEAFEERHRQAARERCVPNVMEMERL